MDYLIVGLVFAGIVAVVLTKRRFDKRRVGDSSAPLAKHVNQPSSDEAVDRSRAARRARSIASRPPKERVEITVIGDEHTRASAERYRAAYELIVRGIDVRLVMAEVYRELGGMPELADVDVIAPHTRPRVTYTTEAFAPHLESINSMADFHRYAPYRADHEMHLAVHPDDLQETYAVLKELGIRLSVMHHPDQTWWAPRRG